MLGNRRILWNSLLIMMFVVALGLAGCAGSAAEPAAMTPVAEEHGDEDHAHEEHGDEDHAHDEHGGEDHDYDHGAEAEMLMLPALTAVALAGEPLQVIATTSIIGDVVANVGGDAIALTTLMGPGQDPHSYKPGAGQLTAVAKAHVIFVNGWNLEEGLLRDLEAIGEGVPIVAVSANLAPLAFGEHAHDHEEHDDEEAHAAEEEHSHEGADPHVWFSVHSVEQWAKNIRDVLSALDPDNAATYTANAERYLAELEELETYAQQQLASISPERRVLVTNHEAFNYFAHDYGFEVLGTVIPSLSTLAEPSASDLVSLIEAMQAEGVCTLFTETTLSDRLAQTVASELSGCAAVQVLPLYTGALGPRGSGADSYVGMFRSNVDAIVAGLTD